MNLPELTQLLTRIQVLDNRQVDQLTIEAWTPLMAGVDYHAAVDAVNRHFMTSTAYLQPAHIVQRVQAEHRKALPQTMSPTVPDDCGHHRWLPNRTCLYCTAHQSDEPVCPDGEHAWMRDGTCRNCPTLYADVA